MIELYKKNLIKLLITHLKTKQKYILNLSYLVLFDER